VPEVSEREQVNDAYQGYREAKQRQAR